MRIGPELRTVIVFAAIAASCFGNHASILVVDRGKGQPLPGVKVMLSRENQSWEFESDAGGSVVLADCPPGAYRLLTAKPGYSDPADPEQAGKLFRISSSHQAEPRVVGMLQAAAIAGQISDEQTRPLSGVAVVAAQHLGGARFRWFKTGLAALTDEAGRYRLHGLPPGQYAVAALPFGDGMASTLPGAVYYPGVPDLSRAELLNLEPGTEQSGVDIRAVPRTVGNVTGSLTDIPSQWATQRALVSLVPRSGVRLPVASELTDQSGRFQFTAVPAGDYDVVASGPSQNTDYSNPPQGGPVHYATMPVTVREGNGNEVTMQLRPGVRIEVQFNQPPGANSCVGRDSVQLQLESGWYEMWKFAGKGAAEGVAWEGLPPATYRFEMPELDRKCTFLGVRALRGSDLPRSVMTIASSTVLTVEVGRFTGEVAGTVRASGQPVRGSSVGLWCEDERPFALLLQTDDSGAFRFDQLPPCRYSLVSLDTPMPEASSLMQGRRKHFQLEPNQKLTVDLETSRKAEQ